jgi:MFS family permease
LVNVPIGLLGVVAALLFIPRSNHLQTRVAFDWVGFALFFPAIVALVFAVSQGSHLGWTSPSMMAVLAIVVVLGTAFLGWERRQASPMIDVSLFHRVPFTAGISTSVLAFLVLFGVLVMVPFYFERASGYGSVRTGLELMVMPVALGLMAPLSGRMADRYGVRRPTVAGMAVTAAGLVALGWLRPSTFGFLGLLAAIGVGLGLFISPNNAGIMASVPRRQSGLASGLLNMSRGLGTALGLAVTTAVFSYLGGDRGSVTAVRSAFSAAILVLAGAAALASMISAVGSSPEPLDCRDPAAEVVPEEGALG